MENVRVAEVFPLEGGTWAPLRYNHPIRWGLSFGAVEEKSPTQSVVLPGPLDTVTETEAPRDALVGLTEIVAPPGVGEPEPDPTATFALLARRLHALLVNKRN